MKDSKQMELIPLTSSQEDIHANRSRLQENKRVLKIRDTSGQSILDLSKSSSRIGLLEKTLVGILNSVSTPYYRTWRVKVTPLGRLVFQLLASVPTTKEKESGLWRTPDNLAGGSNLPGIQKALDEGHLKRPSGQPIQIRLQDQVKEPRLWPTPRAKEPGRTTKGFGRGLAELVEGKQQLFPTPTATERSGINPKTGKGAGLSKTIGGTLNPNWVEWLMGYPTGHTDLER